MRGRGPFTVELPEFVTLVAVTAPAERAPENVPDTAPSAPIPVSSCPLWVMLPVHPALLPSIKAKRLAVGTATTGVAVAFKHEAEVRSVSPVICK